jgi:hypothetical protein
MAGELLYQVNFFTMFMSFFPRVGGNYTLYFRILKYIKVYPGKVKFDVNY